MKISFSFTLKNDHFKKKSHYPFTLFSLLLPSTFELYQVNLRLLLAPRNQFLPASGSGQWRLSRFSRQAFLVRTVAKHTTGLNIHGVSGHNPLDA